MRVLRLVVALVFLSALAHAGVLAYSSSCDVALSWVGPGTLPPVSYSGTGTGANSGCSLTGSTGSAAFTASASDVTASVSGSAIMLSNVNTVPFTDNNNTPIGSSGADSLYGSLDAGVQGSFTGTYELTGLNIANDTVLIPFIKNSSEVNCHTLGGGCITVDISQNGNTVHLNGDPAVDPSLSGIDFSQPFQISIDFEEDITSNCCALDMGGSLNASVPFEVSDAFGNAVSADLAEVPEPGSLALAWAGLGLFMLRLIKFRKSTAIPGEAPTFCR